MGLLRRAAASIKDKNSLLRKTLSRRTPHRNPQLEAAIIRATSHHELCFHHKHAKIVFSWIRTSPPSLLPFITPLSNRIEKTRSWAVALKGLMLVQGVLHCNTPATKQLGRLHFDLSTFTDGHSRLEKTWGFNFFVRAYFAFLDLRVMYDFKDGEDRSVVQEMVDLQKHQTLLDLLLQVRPKAANMRVGLILDAMDYVLAEVSEIQSIISRATANLASKVNPSSKPEVALALQILQKAAVQSKELSEYLEHCEDFEIVNAEGIEVPEVPKEDIRELEGILSGRSKEEEKPGDSEKAVVVREEPESAGRLKTIITETWEVFEEDLFEFSEHANWNAAGAGEDEGLDSELAVPALLPLVTVDLPPRSNSLTIPTIPDLITF